MEPYLHLMTELKGLKVGILFWAIVIAIGFVITSIPMPGILTAALLALDYLVLELFILKKYY